MLPSHRALRSQTGAQRGNHWTMSVTEAFRKQIGWCQALGSPFTAGLLTLLADDLARGGPVMDLVGSWQGDPEEDAVPLRLAGALHALVLQGAAPALAAAYPPHASGDPAKLRSAVEVVLATRANELRRFIASPPQTNEVGRSAVLLGGFLTIAAATRLPLRTLEIGASAGLNLIWDQYRYQLGAGTWGDATSPVRLAPEWEGGLPPMDAELTVAERAGCDVAPIDLREEEQRLRLRAYVWADQLDRLARLDAAIAVARAEGHRVARADAGDWVRERLATPAPGRTTVLYHSIMWQYVPASTQAAIRDSIEREGARAQPAAPLAWLRFEPSRTGTRPELQLDLWPGPRSVVLASAHPHGASVRWLG